MNQQEALLTEIQNLRTDLAALSVRVLALESRFSSVAASREAFSTPSRSPLVINYSGNSSPTPCSYVSGSSPVPLPPFPQQGPAEAATSGTLTSSAPTSTRVSDTAQLAATRIEAAEEAGRFIQRSLAGAIEAQVVAREFLLLRATTFASRTTWATPTIPLRSTGLGDPSNHWLSPTTSAVTLYSLAGPLCRRRRSAARRLE